MTNRAVALHDLLPRLGVDALLFNTSEVLPSANLRYLTGFTGSEASILISPTERRFFTDGRYQVQAREEVFGFHVHVVRNKLASLSEVIRASGVERIGIEPSRVSYEFVRHLARRVPKAEFVPLKREFLENFRIRKSPQEKHNIARAAVLASEACQEVLNAGLTGRSERDVAVDLEFRTLRKGAHGIAFGTIVAAGRRSALPHGTATDRIIGPGELVIIDYGCRFDGYCSDETVTCVTGSPGSDQKKLHKAVYDAHMRALEAVREGVSVRQIDRIARSSLENDGLGKHFKHGLGHGVGLEIHEAPFLSAHGRGTLVEGMVFTIEPGVYIEDVGGVRLESLVYLGPQGTEVLCTMPKDLIVVG